MAIENKQGIARRWGTDSPEYLTNLGYAATVKADALLQNVYDEASQYTSLQALSKKYKGNICLFLYCDWPV